MLATTIRRVATRSVSVTLRKLDTCLDQSLICFCAISSTETLSEGQKIDQCCWYRHRLFQVRCLQKPEALLVRWELWGLFCPLSLRGVLVLRHSEADRRVLVDRSPNPLVEFNDWRSYTLGSIGIGVRSPRRCCKHVTIC